ncbi:class I SAM-dependent methyltransferase [Shimazuella kribbensis]|uniref:class I SAM-dependent methyltransferase n=1 Tax=Shimazuella kribbensis TaxID=139808 RepID=UPI000407C273|nr:class I SAM-dependent methyltransferase [Shimazuella kribbensis]
MMINKEISPVLYQWMVRPNWVTKKYIHDRLKTKFQFEQHTVLDFGSGTGSNCTIFTPEGYIGIEPCNKRVRYSRQKFKDYLFYVLEDNTLPVDDNSVDYIVIIAVLHHISSNQMIDYLDEFKRVLKPGGSILVMEPCLYEEKPISNFFMKKLDKGRYIRNESSYLELFTDRDFDCQVVERFRKCFLYNEFFFRAYLKQ